MPKAIVVDDSRAIRMILARTLREAGFDVSEAGNGEEALQVLQCLDVVDLVMADWNMPVMDGLELLKQIRADSRHAATPVIMVTTEAEVEQMAIALDCGANEYVMKPFTKDILLDKLRLAGVAA
ncbi:MAG TPA: response regulator [Bryobacteraceae bacterium]|nr:response regulator [Bryobacteraceae bacterium]